jgi:hypothetical protein
LVLAVEDNEVVGYALMLVATWAAAEWAIRFYRRHCFELVAGPHGGVAKGLLDDSRPKDRRRRSCC